MHVAIIMDGNGRWAAARGEPRAAGHREGARRIRQVVEAAPALGVEVLSLYAFSADNWKRPEAEVAALMSIFMRHLSEEEHQLVTSGVRLSVIGRRDRLATGLRHRIECVEQATSRGSRLWLRLAIDYAAARRSVRLPRARGRSPNGRRRPSRAASAAVEGRRRQRRTWTC